MYIRLTTTIMMIIMVMSMMSMSEFDDANDDDVKFDCNGDGDNDDVRI